MIRLLADASFNGALTSEFRRRSPGADLLTVNEVELRTADDVVILEWAARHRRVVITSDKKTMIGHANERIRERLPMPGLIFADQSIPPRAVIDSLFYITECGEDRDFENQIIHLPL